MSTPETLLHTGFVVIGPVAARKQLLFKFWFDNSLENEQIAGPCNTNAVYRNLTVPLQSVKLSEL